MRKVLIGGAALAVLLTVAGPAMAQERDIRQARRHMEAGQEYFLQERWGNAAEEFMAAFELRPHTAFLFNAALAYHRLGNVSEALSLYRRYIEEAPNARDRARVEESIRLLERAAATQPTEPTEECTGEDCPETPEVTECAEDDVECQMAQEEGTEPPEVRIVLDPEAAAAARSAEMKSVILVEVEPDDATVVIFDEDDNEVARGEAPVEYTADAGRYRLVLEHPEYRTVRTPVQVTSGRYYIFHIEMSQPPAFLQVASNVPGSTVYLDDRSVGPVGTTPWGNVVSSGTHRIWVERPGYRPVVQDVEVGLGQEVEQSVELERLSFGMARVLTNVDEATVEIDGEEVGLAPLTHQLEPGEHRLVVSARRMKDYETTFEVNRGQTTRILVRMNPRPSRTSAWVSLAFSALTFTAAGIVGYLSTQEYDALEQDARAGRLATDDNRIDRGFMMAVGADVGFGVGTIIAALSLYYFLRDPLPDSEGRVQDSVDFTENPELTDFEDPGPLRVVAPVAPASESPAPAVRESAGEAETPEPAAAPAEPTPAAESEAQPATSSESGADAAPAETSEETDEPSSTAPPAATPSPEASEAEDELTPEARRWLRQRPQRTAFRSPRPTLGLGPGFVLHF